MNEQKHCLSNGDYNCEATLHVKDNKAYVTLHSTFGLADGATLPRSRKEDYLLVEVATTGEELHGHVII